MQYLKACHFGPTALVTTLSFLFSRHLFALPTALLVALTIFTGQLLVGWTNDLVDYQSDIRQGRREKPLVTGPLTVKSLKLATLVDLPICVLLSLAGPLGLRGGALHLLGVGCGVSYNFYFKNTALSPLPYALAFAALPAAPRIAVDKPTPLWVVATGALFGIVAHFASVLKDYESDREIGMEGLPHKLSFKANLFICIIFLAGITAIIGFEKPSIAFYLGAAVLGGAALIIYKPRKLAFLIIMALALISVLAVAL